MITSQPDTSDILSASASLGRQEQWALPAVLPARGLAANGPVRLPKVHAALGFGLALLVLVVLGTVTQASIADLVAANASATRSVEALERLQALKGSVREFEASELATRVPGQPLERDSPHVAYLETIRLRRELNELLDSGPQRQRLYELAAVIVPSRRKAGFSIGIFSGETFSGFSSSAITLSLALAGTVIAAISALNLPSWMAARARVRVSTA